MKNLLLVVLTLLASQSFAQKGQLSLGFGPSFADPLNTNGTAYFKTGIGAGVRGYYGISKNGSFMAILNYVSFANKPKYSISYSSTSFKLGYKTFLNHSNFYVYGDAGLVLISAKDKLTSNGSNTLTTGFGLGVGYSYPLGKNSYLDISPSLNLNNAAAFGRRLSTDLNVSYRINLHR